MTRLELIMDIEKRIEDDLKPNRVVIDPTGKLIELFPLCKTRSRNLERNLFYLQYHRQIEEHRDVFANSLDQA